MRVRLVSSHLFLLGLVLLSAWMAQRLTSKPKTVDKTESITVDYYSIGLKRISMDEEGMPKDFLLADKMTHYAEDGRAELEKPVFTLYRDKGINTWVIKGDTGMVKNDDDRVFLNGNVQVESTKQDDSNTVKLLTPRLMVEPKKQHAETDAPVKIVSKNALYTGVGMRVDFADSINLTLLSKVRGQHETK